MRSYSNKITLTKNGRGIWTIDPIMGCKSGVEKDKKGCFSDCYAARNARIYGYDFTENILRDFEDEKHLKSIITKANKLKFEFIRMGNSGDPSENWDHTIKILEKLKPINKEFVIITRHWNKLNLEQLKRISKLKVCINTSISPIDDDLHGNIQQYEILKNYCKSVLRCVSFNFNTGNKKGMNYDLIQNWIFHKYDVLDTVFRCSKSNPLYKEGIIKIKETKFLGKKCYVSKNNPKTYFGNCENCLEKCGVKMKET
tara:strand:- start:45 stop:812 length:768 start_codon:yes stop_codon:yes gene_type:complete